jgi:hypothetical protein
MNFTWNAPASVATLAEAERRLGVRIAVEYTEFLKKTDGGEGFIGKTAYVILWPLSEFAVMNQAYEIQKYVPGLLIFGSDGSGEMFGFDTRSSQWAVVQVPFVGMTWDLARAMGATFNEFLERLYEIEPMGDSSRQRTLCAADCRGKEVFEITPIILGGSPTDPANKTVLTRADHIKAVVYWNKVIKGLRGQPKSMWEGQGSSP